MQFKLWDYDFGSSNDFMCSAHVALAPFADHLSHTMDVTLDLTSTQIRAPQPHTRVAFGNVRIYDREKIFSLV